MKAKHILLISTCIGSIGAMIGALHDWHEAAAPLFVGGVLVNISGHVAALYMERPNEEPK